MTSPSKPAPNAPRLSLDDVIYILRDPARWKMSAKRATGEPRSNQELADVARLSASAAAKHLEALRYTGVVVKRHGVNYLADGYLSANCSREIDLGGCVLRLDDPKWLKTSEARRSVAPRNLWSRSARPAHTAPLLTG